MQITTKNIVDSNIALLELTLPKSDYWFGDGEDSILKENEYAFFEIKIDGNPIQFSVSADLEAKCHYSHSPGDGYSCPDETYVEDVEATITISEPYSEDAEIAFDLNDTVVYDKLMKLIEKAIY